MANNSNGNNHLDGQVQTIFETLPKKVAILYSDAKREYFPTEAQYITEKDALEDATLISKYLEKMGIEVALIPGDDNLSENLKKEKPEMVFNCVDSVKGEEFLCSAIPGVLELLGIPYTGADILGLAISSNRFLINKLLNQAGIPVPNYQLFDSPNDPLDFQLRFPLILKLNEIHGAVEINRESIVENEKQLRDRLKFLISTYNQSVLVQEFIVGREITAIILQGMNKKVYLAEKVFADKDLKYNYASFDFQWLGDTQGTSYHYEKFVDDHLKELIKKTFDVTKMADYGKIDIRLDTSGRYYFIDINPNSAFGPKEAEVAIGVILEELYGVSFTEILRRLILNTIKGFPEVDYNGTDN